MTESVFCRMRHPTLGSLQLGSWAQETSDRGGQDKANWRSTNSPTIGDRETFVCTLVLKTMTTGAQTTFNPGRLAPFKLSEQFQYASRWRSPTSF
jgi:hypothetical protein